VAEVDWAGKIASIFFNILMFLFFNFGLAIVEPWQRVHINSQLKCAYLIVSLQCHSDTQCTVHNA